MARTAKHSMNYSKLKGRIVEVFGSQDAFGNALGVSGQYVSQKIRGFRRFTIDDILIWSDLLKITSEEIGVYFFTVNVQN